MAVPHRLLESLLFYSGRFSALQQHGEDFPLFLLSQAEVSLSHVKLLFWDEEVE